VTWCQPLDFLTQNQTSHPADSCQQEAQIRGSGKWGLNQCGLFQEHRPDVTWNPDVTWSPQRASWPTGGRELECSGMSTELSVQMASSNFKGNLNILSWHNRKSQAPVPKWLPWHLQLNQTTWFR
jgi:hypothetical protein